MKINDIAKLVCVMSLESLGSTRFNQFLLTDSEGNRLEIEKYDLPNGDYIVYDKTNGEEMAKVKFPKHAYMMSVFILESEQTFDIALFFGEEGDDMYLGGGTINTVPYEGHEIKVKEGKATYKAISIQGVSAPRPEGYVLTSNLIQGIQQVD